MNCEIIHINTDDGLILDGMLCSGDKQTDKILIQTHGMTSNCFTKRDNAIASKIQDLGIDTICYNNRGGEIVRNIRTFDGTKKLGGSAFEDIEECYYDIVGAIKFALERGYKNIYLQGHSLGSTKTVYTYNRLYKENSELLKSIRAVILLSLVDVPAIVKKHVDEKALLYLLKKEKDGKLNHLIETEGFMRFISVKTILKYLKYNDDINFARYSDESYNYEELNNISVPLFMRWGNVMEMIEQSPKHLVEIMKSKINNSNKDLGYIDGASHSYNGKEEELANQIFDFLKNIL